MHSRTSRSVCSPLKTMRLASNTPGPGCSERHCASRHRMLSSGCRFLGCVRRLLRERDRPVPAHFVGLLLRERHRPDPARVIAQRQCCRAAREGCTLSQTNETSGILRLPGFLRPPMWQMIDFLNWQNVAGANTWECPPLATCCHPRREERSWNPRRLRTLSSS